MWALIVAVVAFVAGLALAWWLMDMRRRVIALQLDVAELHENTQEAYSVLVDMAMEDAAGDAECAFDITETNGVVHE